MNVILNFIVSFIVVALGLYFIKTEDTIFNTTHALYVSIGFITFNILIALIVNSGVSTRNSYIHSILKCASAGVSIGVLQTTFLFAIFQTVGIAALYFPWIALPAFIIFIVVSVLIFMVIWNVTNSSKQ